MRINEYRRYAAECLLIADGINDPENRITLLAMAQAWLKLAQRAEQDPSARQEAIAQRTAISDGSFRP
jgi:hypothetical protein